MNFREISSQPLRRLAFEFWVCFVLFCFFCFVLFYFVLFFFFSHVGFFQIIRQEACVIGLSTRNAYSNRIFFIKAMSQ